MSTPRLLMRLLIALALVCGGTAGLVGGLYLRGPGLIAVAVSAALVACLAAGIVRETPGVTRTAPLEAAVLAGGLTVLALLVLAGTGVLSSGVAAAVLAFTVVSAALIIGARRARRTAGRAAPPAPAQTVAAPDLPEAHHGRPVPGLTTQVLGREWLRTTVLLAGALLPDDRAALVRRRQDSLDELELRDPEGFGRWLASGGPESDPADYVHGERTAGTDAA